MEHIKQQIEALREQADKLANDFGGDGTHAKIIMKLEPLDGFSFTEEQANEIDNMIQQSRAFRPKACGDTYNGETGWFYHLLGTNHNFSLSFKVKESRDTEIDRLRRRLAELEGGER